MLSTQTRNNSDDSISIIQNKLKSHDLFSHSLREACADSFNETRLYRDIFAICTFRRRLVCFLKRYFLYQALHRIRFLNIYKYRDANYFKKTVLRDKYSTRIRGRCIVLCDVIHIFGTPLPACTKTAQKTKHLAIT